ncbi:MAG TPA: choice-of-anchor Q domain-containing protein [Polyangiaceae bacterium]|nr:choice-of-anchor Q domain-containing protein [Polyangiaceae bacterium]
MPPPPVAATCAPPVSPADVSAPDRVVGDGSAGSCTEQALAAAVAAGGVITFDCGAEPVTIELNATLTPPLDRDTVLDGGGKVTLSGGRRVRILALDTGNFERPTPTLTLQRLALVDGKSSGASTPLGTATDGGGGAVYHLGGTVVAIDSTFRNNEGPAEGPDVAGGAIFGAGAGETIVVGSTFDGNRCANGGAVGALHTAVTIVNSVLVNNVATGYGANFIDGQGQQAGRGGNGGALSMDGENRALTLCGVTVANNTGGAFGGAVFRTSYHGEPTTIDKSTFQGNVVLDREGDLPSGAGGLYLQGSAVTVTASTIAGNVAKGNAGLWVLGHGAQAATVSLTNVTIAGNATHERADFTQQGIGGGLVVGDNTTGTLLNCTIVGNRAQFASGVSNVSPLTLRNTIISNEARNPYTPLNCTGSSYSSPPGAGDHNLQWPQGVQDDLDCSPGIARQDPALGPPADNGGPTPTVAPQPGSPASGAGADCAPTDQRGRPRKAACTLGAYEVE